MRLILLAAALLAALLAAYLSAGLLRRAPAPQVSQPVVIEKTAKTDVLVAARNLLQGEQLGNFAVEWRPWPRDSISPDMITKDAAPDALDMMAQARARQSMVAGEPIVAAKIVRPGDRGFVSAILPEGMRAIAIPINETTSVSGFILPNDRVDVLLTRQVTGRNGIKAPVTETVLTNVKVLAINQTLRAGDDPSIPGGRTAVLELDPLQAQILTKVDASGTVSLLLRSLSEVGPNGLPDDTPMLSDEFRNPRRAAAGTLIIRYGFERTIPGK